MMISSVCLFGFGLVRSFVRTRMRKSGVMLGGGKRREQTPGGGTVCG